MKKLLAVLALISATTSTLGAAPRATIMVRPNAETAAENAIIADMAAVKCADKSLSQKLMTIQVCSSPLPGKTRIVTKEQILIAMRREGVGDGTVELLCPAEVNVKRTASIVTGQSLFDTAKAFILSNGSFTGTVDVQQIRIQPDQSVLTGKFEVRVSPGTKPARKGQTYIPVEIVIDGKVYKTISVSAMVKLVAPVLVAKQPITRLSKLTDANTAIEERDVTNLPSDILNTIPSSEMSATVNISEGSIIREGWVSAPIAVKSGDAVTVVVESGTTRLSEKGTAVQDGCIGEVIRVRFTSGGREIRGKVSEPGLVKIMVDG